MCIHLQGLHNFYHYYECSQYCHFLWVVQVSFRITSQLMVSSFIYSFSLNYLFRHSFFFLSFFLSLPVLSFLFVYSFFFPFLFHSFFSCLFSSSFAIAGSADWLCSLIINTQTPQLNVFHCISAGPQHMNCGHKHSVRTSSPALGISFIFQGSGSPLLGMIFAITLVTLTSQIVLT